MTDTPTISSETKNVVSLDVVVGISAENIASLYDLMRKHGMSSIEEAASYLVGVGLHSAQVLDGVEMLRDQKRTCPRSGTATVPADLALAAEYLALNILNCGDIAYANEAIIATLANERRRCARLVGVAFPQAEDERAEAAIRGIENGSQPW
jgi:hypothetical protein